MPDFLGFQYRVILDLYRILFHAVVIFGPEHDFLFKSASTYCALLLLCLALHAISLLKVSRNHRPQWLQLLKKLWYSNLTLKIGLFRGFERKDINETYFIVLKYYFLKVHSARNK